MRVCDILLLRHKACPFIPTQDTEYTIYPRINVTRCGVFSHGPVRGARNDELDSVSSEQG